MRLWLLGSPDVKVVLILSWTKLSQGRVKGTVEAFSEDVNGQPYKRQHAVRTSLSAVLIDYDTNRMGVFLFQIIFPDQGNAPFDINITRGELFGTHLQPNTNPLDILPLKMSDLRDQAAQSLQLMGLRPA